MDTSPSVLSVSEFLLDFYHDFILWLLVPGRQYVSFVNPKGIRNLQGADDPKIRFHETIEGLEQRLGDSNVVLNSFVISVTPYCEMRWWEGGLTQEEFEEHHFLFREPERLEHIENIFRKLLRQ